MGRILKVSPRTRRAHGKKLINGRLRSRTLTYFAVALDLHMAIRGYDAKSLAAKIAPHPNPAKPPSQWPITRTLDAWRSGQIYPLHKRTLRLLNRIEELFRLRPNYFIELDANLSPTERAIRNVPSGEQGVLRWHLPKDFDVRPETERTEIIEWANRNVLNRGTEYGQYQSKSSAIKFSVVFPNLPREFGGRRWMGHTKSGQLALGNNGGFGTVPAPRLLEREMSDLISFKTASIAPRGYRRYMRWSAASANVAAHKYGHIFGALTAAPHSPAAGLGLPIEKITFGLLLFPVVWDWYLYWCERRRGFFAVSERSALYEGKALTRNPTGWLRQHPELGERLRPISGLVSKKEIRWTQQNWSDACDGMFQHAVSRMKDLAPIMRMHRDPFIPIMPVLTAKSPLEEYIKIGKEILRKMPDPSRQRFEWACNVRTYLMFRLAIHLGLRQRNIRELFVCPAGQKPRSLSILEERRRGELRWVEDTKRWEVFIPAIAFKNATSPFFKGRPYQMVLPNLQDLYKWIGVYLRECRPLLLDGCVTDPGVFFV
jgi:hypothetical protein